MPKYFIVAKKSNSNEFDIVMPLKKGVSVKKAQIVVSRSKRRGYTARVISEMQLRTLLRNRAKKSIRVVLNKAKRSVGKIKTKIKLMRKHKRKMPKKHTSRRKLRVKRRIKRIIRRKKTRSRKKRVSSIRRKRVRMVRRTKTRKSRSKKRR